MSNVETHELPPVVSLSLSLSHKHTHAHAHAHKHTHTHTRAHAHAQACQSHQIRDVLRCKYAEVFGREQVQVCMLMHGRGVLVVGAASLCVYVLFVCTFVHLCLYFSPFYITGLLSTIIFNRAFGYVRPKDVDSELLETTYVSPGSASHQHYQAAALSPPFLMQEHAANGCLQCVPVHET